jgi:hypothetical protein
MYATPLYSIAIQINIYPFFERERERKSVGSFEPVAKRLRK